MGCGYPIPKDHSSRVNQLKRKISPRWLSPLSQNDFFGTREPSYPARGYGERFFFDFIFQNGVVKCKWVRQNAFQSGRNGVPLRKLCLFSRWFQTSCGGTRETSFLIRVCEESGVSEEAGRVLSRHVRTLQYSRKLWFLQKRLKIPQPHLTRRWQTLFRTWKRSDFWGNRT